MDLPRDCRRQNHAQQHNQAPHSDSTTTVNTARLSTMSLSRLYLLYRRHSKVRRMKTIDHSFPLHSSPRTMDLLTTRPARDGLRFLRCLHRKRFPRHLVGALTFPRRRRESGPVSFHDIDERILAILESRYLPCHRRQRQHLERSRITTAGRMPACSHCVCRPSISCRLAIEHCTAAAILLHFHDLVKRPIYAIQRTGVRRLRSRSGPQRHRARP